LKYPSNEKSTYWVEIINSLVEEELQKDANEKSLEDLLENLDSATETEQHESNTISLWAVEDPCEPQDLSPRSVFSAESMPDFAETSDEALD
jgi:hypothetical protein